jgi:TldD protein
MVQSPAQPLTATDLATLAIDLIRTAGCEYGDVRFCTYRHQDLTASDRSLDRLWDNVSSGFGVRVLKDGAWGFAASPSKTPAEVERIVAKAIEIAKCCRLSQQVPVRRRAGARLPRHLHHPHRN